MSEAGLFIAVVGASGAGKDTLLAQLKELLPASHFHFPRRLISRAVDATEASEFLAGDDFGRARARGDFLIDWEANGLLYAIPASARRELEAGRHVMANLSRAALPALRAEVNRVLVVHVTANADILQQRLKMRGREISLEQQARLQRGEELDRDVKADIRIENNGAVEMAVNRLMDALAPLAATRRWQA